MVSQSRELEPSVRPRYVKEPASAMIILYFNHGWNPKFAICWAMPTSATGEEVGWQFPDDA
eukprot:1335418-Pyramimonas_sp.AAC.1